MEFLIGIWEQALIPTFLALIGFLPYVVVMLAAISFFENTGFVLGFGCTTLAISAIDGNQDQNKKKRLIRFMTFIPCGAKLPVMLFICTMILGWNALAVVFLYAASILLGFAFGGFGVIEKPKLCRLSLPEQMKKIIKTTFEYIKRFGAVALAATAFYCLKSLGLLDIICGALEPVFWPIGLASGAAIAAILAGLAGKEMIIGALVVSMPVFTTASALSFLVFTLLYTPCASCISAIRCKTDPWFAFKTSIFNFVVAYVISFVVYSVGVMLN